MRAKEEILYQHLDDADIMYTKGKYIDDQDVEPIIFKAMDEYAKEIAIAFKNWKEDKYWAEHFEDDYVTPLKNAPLWCSNSAEPEMHTTEELFNQFITSQNHKKA